MIDLMLRDTFSVWRDAENKLHFEDRVDRAGRVIETGRAAFDRFVKASFADGEVFEIEAREYQTTRSAKANRYYWAVVLKLMAEHTGQDADTIHDAMCELFLPNETKRVEFFNALTGARLEVVVDLRRTSKLNRRDFYDFVENVRQWALDFFALVTPDPDPDWWRHKKAA